MTSDNSYTVQIGGNDAFGKAKFLDIKITPIKAVTYSVKIVNTGELCEVFFWDYQGMTLSSLRNIKNCHCGFILIYDLRRDFPFDNRTKNTHNKNLLEIILSQIGKKVLK